MGMVNSDSILTGINILLTIISGIGAYKSVKYFRKSRNLTIFAQTNKALIEIQKMLIKLPEALTASNMAMRGKKGMNLQNRICNIGEELNISLTEIGANIPSEYSEKFRELQNDGIFNLQVYINSYISGEAVKIDHIDSDDYNLCQQRLVSMQEYLKKITVETEEKLQ